MKYLPPAYRSSLIIDDEMERPSTFIRMFCGGQVSLIQLLEKSVGQNVRGLIFDFSTAISDNQYIYIGIQIIVYL